MIIRPVPKLSAMIIVLFWLLLGHGSSALAANFVNILIYHHFGDARYPSANVDTEQFARQMEWLAANDYQVISLAELVRLRQESKELPAKSVVITIDDGYKSVYENAWPILKKHGFPFTLFVYTQALARGYANYMSWEQIRELAAAGVALEDHSFAHHHLAFRPHGLDEAAYRAWIANDLARSQAVFARELASRPRFLALPYGEYNPIVIDEARKLGYEAVLNQNSGPVGPFTDLFSLPRHAILGKDWVNIDHFQKIMAQAALPVADASPASGQLADPLVREFSVRLLKPDDYVAGSFGFWVSGLGWHKARRQGDVLSFSTDLPLTHQVSRVVVSGREKVSGRLASHTWMLIQPDAGREGEG
ncbi:MAG: polysaccharide deacetylase family protein [Thermodesulfobacteriota bacterium]